MRLLKIWFLRAAASIRVICGSGALLSSSPHSVDCALSASCYLLFLARQESAIIILLCLTQDSGLVKSGHCWRTVCILVVSHPVLLLNINIRKYPKMRIEVLQERHHYSIVQKLLLCILTASFFTHIMLIYVL